MMLPIRSIPESRADLVPLCLKRQRGRTPGVVTTEEFIGAVERGGRRLTEAELAEIDTEGDGRITYDEMRGWLARHDGERSQASPEPRRRCHFRNMAAVPARSFCESLRKGRLWQSTTV